MGTRGGRFEAWENTELATNAISNTIEIEALDCKVDFRERHFCPGSFGRSDE